jgi:hypothetical protein
LDGENPGDVPPAPSLALPRGLRELMGLMALVLMTLVLLAAIFGVSYFGAHLSPGILGHCWQVQAVDGKAYKVNTCTGKTVLLKQKTEKDH